MLTKVEVRTSTGALLGLEFDDASNGYVVAEIDGLDPVKTSISSASFPTLPGSQYQSSHRENRNITMTIELVPDYVSTFSVSDLRNNLYNYLMPDMDVQLRFYDSNGRIVNTQGRVESFETSLFSREPAVDISIIHFDPDFISTSDVSMSGNTTSSTTMTTGRLTVPYDGTSNTGVILTLNVNRTLGAFTVYNIGPDGILQTMDFAASLVSGDVLTINTIRGSKAVTLTRSGSSSSLLYGLSAQSINWIELIKGGTNYLRFYATGAAIPYNLTYTPRYGGL